MERQTERQTERLRMRLGKVVLAAGLAAIVWTSVTGAAVLNTDRTEPGGSAQTEQPENTQTEQSERAQTKTEEERTEESTDRKTPSRVCVHDPSVFEDKDGTFYVFGSHTAVASSEDLIDWKQLNIDYGKGKNLPFYGDLQEQLAEPFKWAGYDDGDCRGGYAVWAPDLIWDPWYEWKDGGEGAYLLYVSLSSTWRRSCIAFLAAKEIGGPYSYGGTLVYSGFTKNGEPDGNSTRDTSWDSGYLNLKTLTEAGFGKGGIDGISDSWFNADGSWNHLYAPNAIDPCVFFSPSGENLYMVYGSWSGGIFLLQLDPLTGQAYYPGIDSIDDASGNYVDRYFGVHLAGGDHQSGEGPYIVWDEETGYYYLYLTYGGLAAEGGYNMRLFRSRDVTGPYVDAEGNNAADNRRNGDKYGIKLIGNYAFYDQIGKRAAGHNSQINTADGGRYLVYHQRFDVRPQLEGHEVRVHQQFMNEDDWPVTAVYEYIGEQPSSCGMEEVTGTYELIDHGRKTDGDMLETQIITLGEDGSISGAVEGAWEKKDSGKGYDYVTLSIGDNTYKGIFFRQHKENKDPEAVMTFSAVGDNNTCIWGSMAGEENGEMFTSMAADALKKVILETAKAHGTLPEEYMDCSIEWKSADESVITSGGEILTPDQKVKVDLTAVISCGDSTLEETYHVTVKP